MPITQGTMTGEKTSAIRMSNPPPKTGTGLSTRAYRQIFPCAPTRLDRAHGIDLPARAGKERRGRIVPMAWSTAVKYLGRRPTREQFKATALKRMESQNA
jgi:hypothetical protein